MSFSKEQHVLATNHFLLKEGPKSGYMESFIDANHPVSWETVALVHTPVPEMPSCPICLESTLVAPKITKCGHIFCWPCLQHYFSSSERSWVRCPLCFESCYKGALKSVQFFLYQPHRIDHPSRNNDIKYTEEYTAKRMKEVKERGDNDTNSKTSNENNKNGAHHSGKSAKKKKPRNKIKIKVKDITHEFQQAEFCLLKRSKHSVAAYRYPTQAAEGREKESDPLKADIKFSRVSLLDDFHPSFTRERKQLEETLAESADDPITASFIK